MSCFDERKMEIPNFSTKNKTKKQSEIKGRKMEKINKEVLQINEKDV